MEKWQGWLIIAFVILLGGAWIALTGYFLRFDVSPLDLVTYSDMLTYMIPFALTALLSATTALLVLYHSVIRYIVLGVLILVPLAALVQHYTGLVPNFTVGSDYVTLFFGIITLAVCLIVASVIVAADEMSIASIASFLIAIAVMIFMGGYAFSLFNEARFYEWRNGEAMGYRLKWTYARNDACHCGAAIVWMGDRTTLLRCAGRNYLVASRNANITLTPNRYREVSDDADTSAPINTVSGDFLHRVERRISHRCGSQ
jgi:hypothetical protein